MNSDNFRAKLELSTNFSRVWAIIFIKILVPELDSAAGWRLLQCRLALQILQFVHSLCSVGPRSLR